MKLSLTDAGRANRKAVLVRAAAFFLIVSAAVVAAGFWYYAGQKNLKRADYGKELSAVADLKVQQIGNWRKERLGDARVVSRNPWLAAVLKKLPASTKSDLPDPGFRSWLEAYLQEFGYRGADVFEARGRIVFRSRPESSAALFPGVQAAVQEALRSGVPALTDLYFGPSGYAGMDVLAPVLDSDGPGPAVGVIVFHIDPRDFLFPLIQTWPTSSSTAETLLVRREGDEVVYLNELRHRQGAAGRLRFPLASVRLPAASAVLGRVGPMEGLDYRNIPVLADRKPVPDSPWFMVSKVDLSEIMAPVRSQGRILFLLCLALIGAAGAGTGFLVRHEQVRHLRAENRSRMEREKAETERTASETQYRRLFDEMTSGFAVHEIMTDASGRSVDYRFLTANRAFESLTGLKAADIAGRTVREVIPDIEPVWIDRYGRVALTGESAEFEDHVAAWDKYYFVRAFSPEPGKFATIISDATEKRRAEKAVADSEAKFRALFDNNSAAIAVIDFDTTISLVNDAYCEMIGYSRAEVIGLSWTRQIPLEDLARLQEYNRKRLSNASEAPDKYEFKFYKKNGEIRNALLSVSLVPGLSKIVTSFVDITERKRTETELQVLNERYKALLAAVPDIIMEVDDRKRYTWANRAGLEFFGPDVIGREAADYFIGTQETYDAVRPLFNGSFSDIICLESWQRRKDGQPRLLAWWCRAVTDGHGRVTGALSSAQDITERKKAERELIESRQLLQDITDGSGALIYIVDTEGRFQLVNKKMEQVVGLPREKVVGKTREEFLPKEIADFHWANDCEVLQSREIRTFEEENSEADGRHFYLTVKFPLFNLKGDLYGLGGVSTDITERKQAEGEILRLNTELEERVRQRTVQLEEINHELEAFSYSVSHDLRAPLRSIDGFSQALLEDCGDRLDADCRDHLDRIRSGAQVMGRLIDDMLTLARLSRTEIQAADIDIGSVARTSAAAVAQAHPARAVAVAIADGLIVRSDPHLLRVVFDNLFDNAWKFTSRSPRPSVEFGSVPTSRGPAYFVRDNGVGFDMAYVGKLFNAFQRLHDRKEFPGTGIGLATVQRIVRRLGGRVWAEGREGQGAAFFFTLNETERSRL